MKIQIKDRGWIWEISQKQTAWLAYKCHRCGQIDTYPTPRRFGKECSSCKNELLVYGYVHKVKEVKHDRED